MKRKEQVRREKEAARLKAASERAIARRMAKESVELIEDEQLELMEFAASSKGLPSIMSLDFETLQNLELFRGRLCNVWLDMRFSVIAAADYSESYHCPHQGMQIDRLLRVVDLRDLVVLWVMPSGISFSLP